MLVQPSFFLWGLWSLSFQFLFFCVCLVPNVAPESGEPILDFLQQLFTITPIKFPSFDCQIFVDNRKKWVF